MTEPKNLLDVLRIWLRWKWLIVGVTAAAAITSTVVALMLPNYYKSTALFYPYNLATQDRAVLFSTEASDRVLNPFGDKYDVNKALSICQSPGLITEVIRVYNLGEHYGLDTTSESWLFKAQREFRSNYKAIKTELDNISVTVWDTDPGQAFEMARYIMRRSGEVYGGLIRGRNADLLKSMDAQLALKVPELNNLTDSLASFRDTTSAYYRVLASQHRTMLYNVNQMRTIRDQLFVTAQSKLAAIYVFGEPQVATKKDRPTRWIIVSATTFAAFFFSLLLPILIEKYRVISKALRTPAVA